jgi:hypothetical protein
MELRPVEVIVEGVVPEPILVRLEALDYGVPRRVRVATGVLRWRRIAAPDVAARGAPPQMEPPAI